MSDPLTERKNPFSTLTDTSVDDIVLGLNRGVSVTLKVLEPVDRPHDQLARSFVCIDSKSGLIGISVYNLRHDSVSSGDIIQLAHPYVCAIRNGVIL